MKIPQFRYPADVGTILTLTRPMRWFVRRTKTIGGRHESAAGIVSSYTIRRDYLLDIVLRVQESELSAVLAMIAWAQDNPATPIEMWFEEPYTSPYDVTFIFEDGDVEIVPTRNQQFPADLEIGLVVRRTPITDWGIEFYG